MQQIALFGTSADPPTTGHQTILQWLSQHFDQVVVWASNNPFKSHQASLEQRSTMLQLLIENLPTPHPNVAVYQELSSSRTLETVTRAQTIWPESEFTLVVGSDLVAQLPQWYKVERLLQQVRLLVVPRPGYPAPEDALNTLETLSTPVKIATLNVPNVSSTAYREEGDPSNLPPPIQAYIHRERLYQWQEITQENSQNTP